MMINPFELIEARLSNIENLLLDIKHQKESDRNSVPQEDQLFTTEEAAKFLRLSVPTVYSKVSRSELPSCKNGKRLYFSKNDLTEWIKSGRKKTQADLQEEADEYMRSRKKRHGKTK